jgi:hypothetical protein
MTYSVFGFRSITSLVKLAAGVGTTKGALGQGLDEMMKDIKSGKILDAVKMPWVTGSGMVGLGAAIDKLDLPELKLPEGFPKLGQDVKLPKLPENIRKHFKFGKKKAGMKGDAPAINAGDAPAINAGDDMPAISFGDAPAINAGLGKKAGGGSSDVSLSAADDIAVS